jgi:hypothetical protein
LVADWTGPTAGKTHIIKVFFPSELKATQINKCTHDFVRKRRENRKKEMSLLLGEIK